MKRRIFKYKLKREVEQTIELPSNAEILCVKYDEDKHDICIWAIIDVTEKTVVPMKFFIIGTGWDIEEILSKYDLFYLGTIKEGIYIWHIFSECPQTIES